MMVAVQNAHPFSVCWPILPRVSRSFAFVIRCLPRGLDDAVMTSYLLCRIADTLEDSDLPARERRRALARFSDALDGGDPAIPKADWPETYRDLMAHTGEALACYRSFRPEVRAVISARVREMCEGMSSFCDREIETIEDQNRYCYYVAGLVGNLLTDLFSAYGCVEPTRKVRLEEHAVKFGLALQKVNIIRDVREDLKEGRCFWPLELMRRYGVGKESLLRPENAARAMRVMDGLIEDVWDYLWAALRYLTLLPRTQLRLRMFCAIPLFMAVATLRKCRRNPDVLLAPRPVKIAQPTVKSIFAGVLSIGPSNRCLKSWFRRWEHPIWRRRAPRLPVSSTPWPAV